MCIRDRSTPLTHQDGLADLEAAAAAADPLARLFMWWLMGWVSDGFDFELCTVRLAFPGLRRLCWIAHIGVILAKTSKMEPRTLQNRAQMVPRGGHEGPQIEK